jgi:hypothetical protein
MAKISKAGGPSDAGIGLGTSDVAAENPTPPVVEEPVGPPPSDDEVPEEPIPTVEPVPTGTTAEVLAWVGDDKDRAHRALETEQASSSPRRGLVSELERKLV